MDDTSARKALATIKSEAERIASHARELNGMLSSPALSDQLHAYLPLLFRPETIERLVPEVSEHLQASPLLKEGLDHLRGVAAAADRETLPLLSRGGDTRQLARLVHDVLQTSRWIPEQIDKLMAEVPPLTGARQGLDTAVAGDAAAARSSPAAGPHGQQPSEIPKMEPKEAEYRDFVEAALEVSIAYSPRGHGLTEGELVEVGSQVHRKRGGIQAALASLVRDGTIALHGDRYVLVAGANHRSTNFLLGRFTPYDFRNWDALNFVLWHLAQLWEERGPAEEHATRDDLVDGAGKQKLTSKDIDVSIALLLLNGRIVRNADGSFTRSANGKSLPMPSSEVNQPGVGCREYPMLNEVNHAVAAVIGRGARDDYLPAAAAEPAAPGTAAKQQPTPLYCGRREDYALDKVPLGRGAYARVHPATHKVSGTTVAMKERLDDEADTVRRMRHEVEQQSRLDHPHVMPILDHDSREFRWFTMPIALGDLSKLRDQVDADELVRVLDEAADALTYAHARDLVHRDVTPKNLLAFADRGRRRWVVADWGLVRRPHGMTTARTAQGDFGTAGFAAPELSDDPHVASPAADVYSLGRIAAWAVTRVNPKPNIPLLPPDGPWRGIVRASTDDAPTRRPTMSAFRQMLADVRRAIAAPPPTAPGDLAGLRERLQTAFEPGLVAAQRVAENRRLAEDAVRRFTSAFARTEAASREVLPHIEATPLEAGFRSAVNVPDVPGLAGSPVFSASHVLMFASPHHADPSVPIVFRIGAAFDLDSRGSLLIRAGCVVTIGLAALPAIVHADPINHLVEVGTAREHTAVHETCEFLARALVPGLEAFIKANTPM